MKSNLSSLHRLWRLAESSESPGAVHLQQRLRVHIGCFQDENSCYDVRKSLLVRDSLGTGHRSQSEEVWAVWNAQHWQPQSPRWGRATSAWSQEYGPQEVSESGKIVRRSPIGKKYRTTLTRPIFWTCKPRPTKSARNLMRLSWYWYNGAISHRHHQWHKQRSVWERLVQSRRAPQLPQASHQFYSFSKRHIEKANWAMNYLIGAAATVAVLDHFLLVFFVPGDSYESQGTPIPWGTAHYLIFIMWFKETVLKYFLPKLTDPSIPPVSPTSD